MLIYSRKHKCGLLEADVSSQLLNKWKRMQEDNTITIEYIWDNSLNIAEEEGTR